MSRPRALCWALLVGASAGALAGCGGGGARAGAGAAQQQRQASLGDRVCGAARRAAAGQAGVTARARVASGEAAYLECILRVGGTRLDLVSQAIPQAFVKYDTQVTHQIQNQAEAPKRLRDPGEVPRHVHGLGPHAVWIPSEHEVIATNGTLARGGNYVTVTVKGAGRKGSRGRALATAVAGAALATAPRGPGAPLPR